MSRFFFVVIIAVCLFTACSNNTEEPQGPLFEEQMFVLGTIVNVTIYGESEEKSQKVFHDLLTDFKYMQAAWNPWKKGSLARVNKLLAESDEPFAVGPAVKKLIEQSSVLSEKSEGLFNPAIGGLVKLWGFHEDEMPRGPPPAKEKIESWLLQKDSMNNLRLDNLMLSTTNKNLKLDFGAFAKGYGVDRAIEHLKSQGVDHAIVNAGGDLRAIGSKGNKPWVIGIRHPRGDSVIASLKVKGDESVFSSGDYERYYEYQGGRYHHILDPRTGYPASEMTSVTVVHKSAAIADAAATALFIAGPSEWERIANKLGVDHAMLIDKAGTVYLTPKMAQRIEFLDRDQLTIVQSSKFSQ